MYVICDIDGTVADNSHRAHLVECATPDWSAFLKPELVLKDTPIEGAVAGIKKLTELGYTLVFLTGRHEGLRDVTMRWLLEHFELNIPEERLLMRPEGNLLKPTEFKREQITGLLSILDKNHGVLFLEDDEYMWPVLAEFGVVLRAPECWETMFPRTATTEEETLWR